MEAGFAPVDQALQKARLVVVEPDFVMTGASGKIIAAKAAQAVAGLDRLAQPGAGAHDFNLTLDVETARIPALEAFTQVNEPAALHVGGVLTKFPLPGRGSLVDWLENWRQADGLLALGKATLSNGTTQIEASGPLGFDGEHRLTGKLALKLRGADAVLARFGVSGSLLNPGNLLGSLFGKVKKPAPDGDSGAGGIRLPLTLQGGKVLVGPLPLPFVLQPLY